MSAPTASPPEPAEYDQYRPPARQRPAPATAKTRSAQQTSTPTRPPPPRTPALRPTTADPSRAIANPVRNRQTPSPAGTRPDAVPPPHRPTGPQTVRATRPPPARGRMRLPWRTSRAGYGDGSRYAPHRRAPHLPQRRPSTAPASPPPTPRAPPSCPRRQASSPPPRIVAGLTRRALVPGPVPAPHAHWCHRNRTTTPRPVAAGPSRANR